MAYKPNEQRMGSGGRRLFDGGAATESMAGSMFRKFWAFAAGAMGAGQWRLQEVHRRRSAKDP